MEEKNNIDILYSPILIEKLYSLSDDIQDFLISQLEQREIILKKFPEVFPLTDNLKYRKMIIKITKQNGYIFYYAYLKNKNQIFFSFFRHFKEKFKNY